MSETGNALGGTTHYYVGEDDCKKASCNWKQEFPKGDDPYCLVHSLENYFAEDRSLQTDTEQ